MTIKLITSFVLAFLIASAFGKFYVPWLRKQKAGQEIKSQVDWHKSKAVRHHIIPRRCLEGRHPVLSSPGGGVL